MNIIIMTLSDPSCPCVPTQQRIRLVLQDERGTCKFCLSLTRISGVMMVMAGLYLFWALEGMLRLLDPELLATPTWKMIRWMLRLEDSTTSTRAIVFPFMKSGSPQ
jgi:hypothetical protein